MWLKWFRNEHGGTAVVFAIAAPLMLLTAGKVLDLARMRSEASYLQEAVDTAALSAAKEMSLADVSRESLAAVAEATVVRTLQNRLSGKHAATPTVTTEVRSNPMAVVVSAAIRFNSEFGEIYGLGSPDIRKQAEARVVGNPNICVLALEPSDSGAVRLDNKAHMRGNKCSVFSNSRSASGLIVQGRATLEAASVCSAGGASRSGTISPAPYLDCPQFADPLASRREPKLGGCIANNLVIDSQTTTLRPGHYCGGLSVKGTSRVRLEPGVYIISAGALDILDYAAVIGDDVSIFLDSGSVLRADPETTVQLNASKSGDLAGLLFFASRTQPAGTTHRILSKNAQVLVGTIYMPNNLLVLDGDAAVGGASAYTAIVARRIELQRGPVLVLNTNYEQTDVPVPDGIRGATQPVVLTR